MTNWNDEWVILMQNGDDVALEHCYVCLSPLIYSAIKRICHDGQAAQDLLQDTFINAFEHLADFDRQYSFVAWLKRIAFNNTFNYLKKQKRSFELIEQYPPAEATAEQPEQLTIDRNLLGLLLSTVPANHRLILWLYLVEQYSHQEIGELVEKSASYSKSIVWRSLQKLQSHPAVIAENIDSVNANKKGVKYAH